MDPYKHSILSVRRLGGKVEDYYPIHSFLDSTKELCSDNRHRILHNLWGIRRVILPIFGNTITNSDGKKVLVKEICEKDHILPDYNNRFIPSLIDFVEAMSDSKNDSLKHNINKFHKENEIENEIASLLLSPLAITGQVKSLVITHNSWFLNEIIPKIFKNRIPKIIDFDLLPSQIFENMEYKSWMNNGIIGKPKSNIKFNNEDQ